MKNKFLLIDTNSIIHRAFHALPPLTTKEGDPVGAIYGSLLAFFRVFSEFEPQYVAAVFDSPGKTFRHEKYEKYKEQRPKAPTELIFQIKEMRNVFREMGVSVMEKEGWEADDVIGTLSSFSSKEMETVIVSGDGDVLQLAQENINIHNLKRGVKEGVFYDKEKVKERYDGISPENIPDVKALQGDPSDNIPGVGGIGEKTAIKLIKEFGNLENLYSSLSNIHSEKLKKTLESEKEMAFLSKDLATIKKDRSFKFNFSDFYFDYKKERVVPIFERFGFSSLIKRLPEDEKKVNLELGI